MRLREFTGRGNTGLTAFIAHLQRVERGLERHHNAGLNEAAKIIEDDAKEQIGHYQGAVGPFPAWAPLSPVYEAAKIAAGGKANAPLLFSGAMRDSISREVHDYVAVVGAKDPVMIYHEFGTSKMPPRPVFGPAVVRNRKAINRVLAHALVNGLLEGDAGDPSGEYFGGHIGLN